MNKPKIIFSIAAFFLVCLLSASDSLAQTPTNKQVEPSYEVVLQVLIASNAAEKNAVPQTLSNVVKKLKNNYSFSNYRLSSTYLQRVANTGNIEFKGVSNEPNQDAYAPTFSDWSLSQLLAFPYTEPQNSVSIQNFRFGQRVPLKTANNALIYEQVGLTMAKLNLPVNTPTIIGTLSTSKPDELMFLILTVKPAEE